MSFGEVHYSSETDLWATPQAFFDAMHREFNFTIDTCANAENAKCAEYFTAEQDGLKQDWTGTVWCNPPYGKDIGLWVEKAMKSAISGATVVVLVFARTDTEWWHRYAMQSAEIRFIRGRLKFGSSVNSAPSPSALLVFRPGDSGNPRVIAMSREGSMGKQYAPQQSMLLDF